MKTGDFSRKAIDAKLATQGDYVKIDFLSRCLKQQLDYDTKKFVLVKLSSLYESRKMYLDGGKAMRTAADINVTVQQKIADFLKATELFIKAGNYEEAETTMKKAISDATDKQRREIHSAVKTFYQSHTKQLLLAQKRNQAAKAYDQLLGLDLLPDERAAVKQELMKLYDNLGKVREYYDMQRRA